MAELEMSLSPIGKPVPNWQTLVGNGRPGMVDFPIQGQIQPASGLRGDRIPM